MRYVTEFTAPRPFFMTKHLQAWVVIDTEDPRSLEGYQMVMCANKTVAEAIALALNKDDISG